MSESTTRYVFALLCALGMLAIGLGAVLEVARFRRHASNGDSVSGASTANDANRQISDAVAPVGSLLSPRQFRLRLFSAALWMLVLGALYYAVTVQWPTHHGPNPTPVEIERARAFAMTLICAFAGMFVGFGLLVWDMIQLARERQVQTARFHQGLADLARRESGRIQSLQTSQNTSPSNPNPIADADSTPT